MDYSQLDPALRPTQSTITATSAPPSDVAKSNASAVSISTQAPIDSTGTLSLTGPSPSAPPPQTPNTLSLAHHATPHDSSTSHDDPNKRPRACEACRGLKVRCEPDPNNPDTEGPCKRCAKAGRACLVTQPTRKRQKKTDSRVAELEKKIDALTASLQASRQPQEEQNGYNNYRNAAPAWGAAPAQQQYAPGPQKSPLVPPMTTAGQKRRFAEITSQSPTEADTDSRETSIPRPRIQETDIVERGIITMEQANEFFARYTEHMVSHLPAVVFAPETTPADIRKSTPILFLAVMAASSYEVPNVQRQLVKELMQAFAEKVIISGEKSLEMVQALQVGVIWYFPPENFEELKFYQFVHMGAVMAIDIGLGRKNNNPNSRLIPYTWRDHPMRKTPMPDPSSIEARRAWLSCYFLASNVAMALHRPNLIRWTAFMTECMDILESSPEAVPSDKYLCHLVWTHRLAEEVGIQFSMDDPNASVNVAEPKIQYALKGFENDLKKYSDSIPSSEKHPSLALSFHMLSLYMHEIALYVDKDENFRPPFNADALRDPVSTLNESLTAAHIGALSHCLTAIDGIFDTFLAMDIASIRCLPVFNFVRVAYAVVVLIKMYFSASTPNSELGKVINKDNMKVEEYLEKLLDKFRETAAGDKSRPAGKFLVVLAMLRNWFHKQGKPPFPQLNENRAPPSNYVSQTSPTGSESKVKKEPTNTPAAQQQNDYNPANTPLQLLSEIATGNQNSVTGGNTPNTQPFQSWMQTSQPYNPMYDPTTGQGGVMPYMNTAFTSDFDYGALGDGFEQAMGLTLGGVGGNPSDPNYENSMQYVMGDGFMGPMLEVMPGGMFQL